ncbi:sensor histidine kinase [Aquibium oceanicum]|uniref:histidine kinase n=1 Tax=Aquibium oceanicum TaxID=1670800 RepID=A0A1L3SY07_9HYPH|nr:sensor histidine kinase [Aquibium oceanicum]APH74195.1 hypothetical protein BSQ44_24615 [Aquibium oceanicum]
MIGLALLTTAPLAIFSALLVNELREGEYQALQRRTIREAEAISRLVERQLHDMSITLRLLEVAPELPLQNFEEFHDRAQLALRGSSWNLLLLNAEGDQLLNTRVDYGTPLGKTANLEAYRQAQSSGQMVVSDLFYGRVSETWVYNITKVVDAAGVSQGSLGLILTQNASDLIEAIGERTFPSGWHYAVVDGSSKVVASSNGIKAGDPIPAELQAQARSLAILRNARNENTFGYAKIAGAPWETIVWGPTASAAAPIQKAWLDLILLGLLFFVLSVISGAAFGYTLRRSIREIARRANQVGHGEIIAPLQTGIREINQVSVALSEASFDRSQAHDQLQTVLREMSHRIKNIIQITQVLIRQSARHFESKEEFLDVVLGRLNALGQSVELLSSQTRATPMFGELIDLQLQSFIDNPERVRKSGEDFQMAGDAVRDLGMILHELATNATKYGAWSDPGGRVEISWDVRQKEDGEVLQLTWVEVDGPPAREAMTNGFGSRLIETTVSQLRGSSSREFLGAGVVWTFEFPNQAVADTIEGASTAA